MFLNPMADMRIDDEELHPARSEQQIVVESFKDLVKKLKKANDSKALSKELDNIRKIFATKSESEIDQVCQKMLR